MELLFLYLLGILIPFVVLVVGFVAGRIIEREHLRSLGEREAALGHLGISNLDPGDGTLRVTMRAYVDGQAVIAADVFKQRIARIRNFFGGEMRSIGTVVSRARREAIVRLLENAEALGANQVWNLRVETSNIGGAEESSNRAMSEVHAYGTAVRVEPR